MIRKALCVVGLSALLAVAAGAQTLDEVLAKYYEARGGLDKIAAVDTAKITGTMTMGPGVEAPFTWYWKRPNKLRVEFTVQGQTGVQAYDGTTAWMYLPFMGKTEPEKMPDEQIKNMEDQADFEGALVNWKEKGNEVELVGEESIEGTDAYKLKITRKSGDVDYDYLDAEYYLEIKSEGTRTMRGQPIEFESSIGDYKEVDGLMIPFSVTSKAKGAPAGQTVTFKTVELNVPVDDSIFAMPAPEAKEKPAEPPSN
jgi:outer membrane lipoprotein-sorting protein